MANVKHFKAVADHLERQLTKLDKQIAVWNAGLAQAEKEAGELRGALAVVKDHAQQLDKSAVPSTSDLIVDLLPTREDGFTVAALTAALQDMGFRSKAKNPSHTVRQALRRLKEQGFAVYADGRWTAVARLPARSVFDAVEPIGNASQQ